MKKIIVYIFLLFSFSGIAQKTKPVDSTQIRLRQSLDSILKQTPDAINVKVLKSILKKIDVKKKKPEQVGWRTESKLALLFSQSAFNTKWQGGGTSNVSGNAAVNYNFNYKKKSLTWDNKIIADYGLTFLKDENFARKTNDRLEFSSRLGQRIGASLWNYSLFINFRSQFAKGYRFSKNPQTDQTIRIEETHFLSPAFVQIGPGVLWKKNNNFLINMAPLTSRMIFVDDFFTTTPEYNDGDYFGVDAGESSRFEFGGSVVVNAKFKVWKNITFENLLNLYTNYIEDPYNVDIDYTLNINLIFNKYISGSFTFQAIYDDNAIRNFQVREVLGLGLSYAL